MKLATLIVGTALALTALLTSTPAKAVTYGFEWIGQAGTQAADDVSGQLFVDVTDAGSGQALFTFRNDGPTASIIREIYFDDGTLLGIASLDETGGTLAGGGVDFTAGSANPGNLPDANQIDPSFQVSQFFLADTNPPAGTNKNGIDPGESLGVLFNLINGTTFTDLVDAISTGLGLGAGDDPTGTLRIGIHVGGIGSDGSSDSFVNTALVPIPAGLILLLTACAGLAGFRRRAKKVHAA